MATPLIVPRADSEGGLGSATKYWASAYIDTILTTGNVGIGEASPGTPLQITSTAPYITLKNSTAENTSGGAESRIIFEDHSNAALGQIEVSHNGNNDNTLGNMLLQTSNGSALVTALELNSSQNASFAGDVNILGATGTTEGGGIDASDAVSITVGEINGEIITNIFVDIGVGSIQSSSTNTGALGNGTDAAAYITQVTTAINGIVYKAELICVEAPAVASGANNLDIDLSANASSIASGSAVSGTPVCESAGSATLGRLIKNTAAITPDHYLYLAQSGTNAGVYNAGKFLIRLYGAKTTGL